MADLKLLAKGGFAVLVVVSLAVLIERLTSTSDSWDAEFNEPSNQIQLINTTLSPTDDIKDPIYNERFAKCLREYSKSYYYPINQDKNISYFCLSPPGRCMHHFVIEASKHLQSLDINLLLIEPSLLFCLLPSSRKYNLLTRGFSSSEVKGLKNVLTLGVHSSEAKILDSDSARKKIILLGYKILRFQPDKNVPLVREHASENVVSHFFLIKHGMVLHLVVFYPKETYLFSPAFDRTEISLEGIQYVNDRAFENFNTSTEYLDTLSESPIWLPSDIRCFLLDMMSSEFIHCNNVISNGTQSPNADVIIALKELKVVLASQMVTFWLWSKSMQGWHEKCDIQHYSKRLEFSVAAKSVEGFNFSALFANSKCQYVEMHSTVTDSIRCVELNCYGTSIHLIFMYEDKITYWIEHIDDENSYKLRFPKFTLCSADVFGQKVNVPCETGEILDSEYGQFLKNSTLNLDPLSMKNVMLMESI